MDLETLVDEQIAAGAEFLRKLGGYCHINAAFWLRSSETGRLNLYLSSDEVTAQNFGAAYGEVLRIALELGNPNFDPFQVKIIWTDNPMAQAAIRLYEKRALRIPTRLTGRDFGGADVDEVYIYPPAKTVGAN